MQAPGVAHTIQKYQRTFHPVVPFKPSTEKLVLLDFTGRNNKLTSEVIEDIHLFSAYIDNRLQQAGAKYGIGGYDEHRTVYSRSRVFDPIKPGDEPRRLHLGTDIWGPAGTPVYAFMGGMIHSFAYNDAYGDYGATLILLHQLDALSFHTLYGHLSRKDIAHLQEGQYVSVGQKIAHFGEPYENGHWPPHLHFQIVQDMELKKGDYPGVCKYSYRAKYLANCPDPDIILQLNKYV